MNFLKIFKEDLKYYDSENKEVKTILKYIKLKKKRVLDIGTGIGRLAFPLSKYAGEIVALDKDKRFKVCFKNKNRKIIFVNKKLEDYSRRNQKFEIILLSWPIFDINFLKIIKKLMNGKSLLIFITCDNKSDYETIIDKIGIIKFRYLNKNTKDKRKFLKSLPDLFKIIKKRKIKTYYKYPNEKIAFRIIKNGLKLWFNINLNKKAKEKLKKLIKLHKKRNKVIFREEIYFYIMKLKCR
jgi:2-polyprenyl-3-methyl-5-hydroxy-6-metoxy-1,4-benzoquinol methylase